MTVDSLRTAWLAEIGLVSWRGANKNHRAPLPAELVATFVVFGGLGLLTEASPSAGRVAGLFGWGLVLATFLNLFDPSNPLGKANAQAAARQAGNLNGAPMSGSTSAPAPAAAPVPSTTPGAPGRGGFVQ